jgi:glucosamine kinase
VTELVLGIDGGGSKTQLCLAQRDGTIVYFAEAGGSNPHDNPEWKAIFADLAAGIRDRLPQLRSATIGVGSYGESRAVDRLVDDALRQLFPITGLDIENDVYLANDAAFLGHAGLLLIAGTGSMLVARSADGRRMRVGGWGVPAGDEGSAYWIGREAISLTTRMLDGRIARTPFADEMLAALLGSSAATTEQLFEWLAAMPHPRSQIASLSRLVDALAATGDGDAIGLLGRAADHLAEYVVAGRKQSGLGNRVERAGGHGR